MLVAGNYTNQANRSQNIAIIALYGVLVFRCEIVLPARKSAVMGLYCVVMAWCGQSFACRSQERIHRYCNISVYIYYAQTEQPEIVHHQQTWYILLNIYWHILCAVLFLGQPKQWTLKTEHRWQPETAGNEEKARWLVRVTIRYAAEVSKRREHPKKTKHPLYYRDVVERW